VTTGAKSTSRTPKNKEIFFADPGSLPAPFSSPILVTPPI
jgi:hypothetical protein